MIKKGYHILLSIIVIIILVLFGTNYLESDTENITIYQSALELFKKDISLQNSIIGERITLEILSENDKKEIKSENCNKIIIALMDSAETKNNYQSTVINAVDYYTELNQSKSIISDFQVIIFARRRFENFSNYIEKYYNIKVNTDLDTLSIFEKLNSISDRGAVTLLLSKNNICIYAYYLENDNNRKLYDKTAVILRLFSNQYEQ